MGRTPKYAAAVAATALAALLITPLGTWLAGVILVRLLAADDWQVDLGSSRGALLGRPVFADVRLRHPPSGTSIEAPRLALSVWDYEVDISGPRVELRLGGQTDDGTDPNSAESATGLTLPVGLLPNLSIADGSLQVWRDSDSLHIELADVAFNYARVDTGVSPISGLLTLMAPRAALRRRGQDLAQGSVSGSLALTERALDLRDLTIDLKTQDLSATVISGGRLRLASGFPLRLDCTLWSKEEAGAKDSARVSAEAGARDSVRVWLTGSLQPLSLKLVAEGGMQTGGRGLISVVLGGRIDQEVVVLDSALVTVAGGEIRLSGSYRAGEDSLKAAANFSAIAIDSLLAVEGSGQLEGELQVAGRPMSGQLAAVLEAQVRAVRAFTDEPLDVHLRGRLNADSTVKLEVHSPLGKVTAEGWLDVRQVAYDLAVRGRLQPAAMLGQTADPIQLEGRVRPDSVTLRLEMASLPFLSGEFGPLAADVRLVRGRFLEVDLSLEETQALAHLAVDLEAGWVDTLQASTGSLRLERFHPDVGGVARVHLGGAGSLQVRRAAASAQLSLEGLSYRGWRSGPMSADIDYRHGGVAVEIGGSGLTAMARLDSTGAFSGRVQLESARFSSSAEADRGPIADSLATGDFAILSGEATWRGAAGRPQELTLDVVLEEFETTLSGLAFVAQGTQRLHHSRQQTTVDSIRLLTPAGLLRIGGTLQQDSLALMAKIDSVALTPLVAGLAGSGVAAITIGGTRGHPVIRGRLDLRDVTLSHRPIGDVGMSLSLADSLRWTVSLDQQRFQLGAPVVKPPETTDSPETGRQRQRDASGSGDSGAGDSSESKPHRKGVPRPEPALQLSLTAPATALLDSADAASGEARLELRARDWRIGPLLNHVLKDSTTGILGFDGALSLPANRLLNGAKWTDLTGSVSFDQLQVERGKLRLRLDSEEAGLYLAPGNRGLELRGFEFPVEVYRREDESFGAGGHLSIKAETDGAASFQVTASLVQVDLQAVEEMFARGTQLPLGTASARVSLTDSTGKLSLVATVEASLDELGEITARIDATAELVTAELEWYTPVPDLISVGGSVPWDLADGRVDWHLGNLTAHSEGVNLFVFLDQFPQLQSIDGFVKFDLEVEEVEGAPMVRGRIDAEELELTVLDVKPGFLFPKGHILFDGRQVQLGPIVGRTTSGKGEIELTGFVRLDSLSELDYRIELTAKDVPYNYDDVFEVSEIDVDLTFSRTEAGSLLEGDIGLKHGVAETALVDLNAPPVPPPPPAVRSPFLEATELNVFIELSDLAVKNELADLKTEGGVRIYGTFYKPRFQGELRVPEGKVIALSREFTFSKGRIVLDQLVPTYSLLDLAYDPMLLDPQLELEAVTTVVDNDQSEEYEITMEIRGPAREAAPRFSAPGLGDADVISILAFGSIETPEYGSSLYTAAGQLLLSRQVHRVGLDEFQILPSGTGLENVGTTSVRMGKFFAFPIPVWVRYEATTREPSFGELQLQYKLKRIFTINANAQSEYNLYGVGIGLKKDF